jgi:hypothetical protein
MLFQKQTLWDFVVTDARTGKVINHRVVPDSCMEGQRRWFLKKYGKAENMILRMTRRVIGFRTISPARYELGNCSQTAAA